MVSLIRTEITVSVSLANIYVWLAQNRGRDVRVVASWPAPPRHEVHLRLGLPISAARAVICDVWLVDKQDVTTPLLSGRLFGLVNPHDDSVRLIFEGYAGQGIDEGASFARCVIDLVAAACEQANEERLTA